MNPIPKTDIDKLRHLAEEQAKIADFPVHREKAELWRRMNQLQPARPMVWINEICWNEINFNNELTPCCESEWAREQEVGLRKLLYQWRHLPADMIVNDYISCPLVWNTTGIGMLPEEDTISSDATSAVVSHRYKPQFLHEKDVEKIQMPVVTFDREATEALHDRMCKVYGDKYVISRKPSPVVLAWEVWDAQKARADLVDFLDQTHGLSVEIILEDISTVRYDPRRLWERQKVAMETVDQYWTV